MITLDLFKDKISGTYKDEVQFIIDSRSHRQYKSPSSIRINNCIFEKGVSINCIQPINNLLNLVFSECHMMGLSTPFIRSKKIRLYIVDCVVENFNHSSGALFELEISNSFGKYFISNIRSIKISFLETNLFVDRWSKKSSKNDIISFETYFYIYNCININIHSDEISKIFLESLVKSGSIKLNGKFKNYYLHEHGHSHLSNLKYHLSKEDKEKLNISISIDYTTNLDHKSTKIHGGIFKFLSLKGYALGDITIENLKVDNVYLRNFSPQEKFHFMDIEPFSIIENSDTKLEFHKSILDNTWLYGVNFKNYNSISFFKTSFLNTKISSSIFPDINNLNSQIKSLENVHYQKNKSSQYYREQYDTFLELKKAFDNSGNVYEAQKMKSVAFNSLRKVKGLSFWNDKFLLTLNRLSSNHGISPKRAFIWILFFLILFHTLIVYSYKSVYFNFNSTYEIISKNLRYIFIIANPAHKVSNLVSNIEELTFMTYALSFISRIFLGYLYYQFVASFRRFGRN